MTASETVTVLVSRDATELSIAQSLLRSEGIASVIHNERRASLPFPTGLPAALGGGKQGARLAVGAGDATAARELLLALRQSGSEDGSADGRENEPG